MLTAQMISERIAAAMPTAAVDVRDTTGTGDHFAATVEYEGFAGASRIDQHRMVYACVQEFLDDGRLHALAITTRVPTTHG